MNWSAALPTFFITLREGVEAALVVGIVFACLQQAQQQKLHRWVYLGVISAVIASFIVGLILNLTIQGLQTSDLRYAPVFKQLFEMGLELIAISMQGNCFMTLFLLTILTKTYIFINGKITVKVVPTSI